MISSGPDGSTSFGGVAAAYAQRRPGYPAAVFEALEAALAGPRRMVVDLGAGSGQATRELAARFEAVTAVEPDARMLAEFPKLANVRIVNMPAEGAAFPDASIDAVIAATAFHWMDQPRVIANAHRWLRSGGVFFPFMYDAFDIDSDAGATARAVYLRHAALWAPFKDRRLIDSIDYAKAIAAAGCFAEVRAYRSEIVADMPAAGAALMLGTASFVNAYVQAQGRDMSDYIRELTDELSACSAMVRLRAPLSGAITVR